MFNVERVVRKIKKRENWKDDLVGHMRIVFQLTKYKAQKYIWNFETQSLRLGLRMITSQITYLRIN